MTADIINCLDFLPAAEYNSNITHTTIRERERERERRERGPQVKEQNI
jgi:hypothetical protein